MCRARNVVVKTKRTGQLRQNGLRLFFNANLVVVTVFSCHAQKYSTLVPTLSSSKKVLDIVGTNVYNVGTNKERPPAPSLRT